MSGGVTLVRWCGLAFGLLIVGDAQAQQFSRLPLLPDGRSASVSIPAISADGRFVAFSSSHRDFLGNDVNQSDVFVHDRQTSTTSHVSVTSGGEWRPGDSFSPRINEDGRFVAFTSTAALVTGDTQMCDTTNCADVYIRDRQTGTTTRVSVSSTGEQAIGASQLQSISSDGRWVTFSSGASNLVEGDTNGVIDMFLHDRQTGATTRFSVMADGAQAASGGTAGSISRDGSVLVYSGHVPVSAFPRPDECLPGRDECPAIFIRDRESGQVTMLSSLWPAIPADFWLAGESFSFLGGDGTLIAVHQQIMNRTNYKFIADRTVLFDRRTGRVEAPPFLVSLSQSSTSFLAGFGASGRILWKADPGRWTFIDRTAGVEEVLKATDLNNLFGTVGPKWALSESGRFVVFSSWVSFVADDTNGGDDLYVYDRDQDGDGMPGAWETQFGLNPLDPADANGDADGDGIVNRAEFDQHSHPTSTFTRYLAEGASNSFFSTQFAAFNPGDAAANVVFRFLGSSGLTSAMVKAIPAKTRVTIDMPQRITGYSAPENDFSTVIESDRPVVVDRTMTWDATRFGSHAETAIEAPSTTWYFAEGATHGDFDLFYLLQNPNDVDVTVTITYLRLAPLTPLVIPYTVPAHSRRTIWVDKEGPELEAVDTAAMLTSTQPMVAERAMYSSRSGQPFAAGHGGAAIAAPALKWFLAEGATGQFFDLYVLVANPGDSPATLDVTYLLPAGDGFTKRYEVGPRNRLTIGVDTEDPRLLDTPVSVIVESVNGQPVVVERTMLWPEGRWYEMHLSAGTTTTGTKWALAEGQVGDPAAPNPPDPLRPPVPVETYVLIANTSPAAGVATISLYLEDGSAAPAPHVVQMPGNSRITVPMTALLPGRNARFGTIVESDGIPIVVERAMYADVNNLVWGAGTASLATKLQ